jgi:hypothetical protein
VESRPAPPPELEQLLPRTYGRPTIFAIARDPKSLFVYWDIDWLVALGHAATAEPEILLRVYDMNNREVCRLRVEPMANNCDISLTGAGEAFRVELGYFDSGQVWHDLAASQPAKMPTDKVGALEPGDFALVPFHITFQRLTELFHSSPKAETSLAASLADLKEKAADPERHGALNSAEKEIYQAMKAGASQPEDQPRKRDPAAETKLQRKLERIVRFGPSSRAQ